MEDFANDMDDSLICPGKVIRGGAFGLLRLSAEEASFVEDCKL
jgi:hypothetical protein